MDVPLKFSSLDTVDQNEPIVWMLRWNRACEFFFPCWGPTYIEDYVWNCTTDCMNRELVFIRWELGYLNTFIWKSELWDTCGRRVKFEDSFLIIHPNLQCTLLTTVGGVWTTIVSFLLPALPLASISDSKHHADVAAAHWGVELWRTKSSWSWVPFSVKWFYCSLLRWLGADCSGELGSIHNNYIVAW